MTAGQFNIMEVKIFVLHTVAYTPKAYLNFTINNNEINNKKK